MRLPLLFLLVALLPACGLRGIPVPQRAILSTDKVTVFMTDGSRCVGRPETPDGSDWQGILGECATPYPFAVSLGEDPELNLMRLLFEEIFGEANERGALFAFAELAVFVPENGTTYIFDYPGPPDQFDGSQSGQNSNMAGIEVTTTITSSGSPIGQ